MNWIKLFLIFYIIYFIAVVLIVLALYLKFILIDIANEEQGLYSEVPGCDHNRNITATIFVALLLIAAPSAAQQQHFGYRITITNADTHHTKLMQTVKNTVVDSIVINLFTPAITTFNSAAYFSTATANHFDFTANNTYMYCEKMRVKTTKKGKLKFLKLK